MKKLIRLHCYETNSSSSHVISLAKGETEFVIDTIYPDQDGIITVYKQDFGWEWEKYNDAISKLAYAYQDNVDVDMLKEVVIEQTGANDVIFKDNEGYLDHQSVGTAKEICTNKEDIRNFIFNKNTWLFTGNDNDTPDPTFYDVPEIKDGRMIMPKYKYQLIIDRFERTTKFKEAPGDQEISDAVDSLFDYNTLLTENGYFITDDSIIWKLERSKNTYYVKSWEIEQDFSTGEIRFLKENDRRIHDIMNDVEIKKLNWSDRVTEITKKALEADGLVKTVKFTLKKL